MITEMEISNIYTWWDFIEIGYVLQYLREAKAEAPVGYINEDEPGIIECLRIVLDKLDSDLALTNTTAAAQDDLTELVEQLRRLEKTQLRLGEDLQVELQLVTQTLTYKLRKESEERSLFPAIPANHIKVEILLDAPEKYFGLSEYDALCIPKYAILDFNEAAQCFAINLPAPAIIFALRGVEGLTRAFYQSVFPYKSTKEKKWYDVVEELKEKDVSLTLVNLLHKLRKDRNDAMHAGSREGDKWTTKAAAQIFNDSRRAVIRMSNYLRQQGLTFVPESAG